MLTLRWRLDERASARAPSRYSTRPVAGAGVAVGRGVDDGRAVGDDEGAAGGLADGPTKLTGVSEGIASAHAARPTADAAAPSCRSRRRVSELAYECIG